MTDISGYLEAYFLNFSGLFYFYMNVVPRSTKNTNGETVNIFIAFSLSGVTAFLD